MKQHRNACNLVFLFSIGNTALQLHIPSYVKTIVQSAEEKQKMVIKIQSVARRNVAIALTFVEMEKIKKKRESARTIQKIVRGRIAFQKYRRPRLLFASSKSIQKAVRGCIAKRLLGLKRAQLKSAVTLQCAMRCSIARSHLKSRRNERKAIVNIQKIVRGRIGTTLVNKIKAAIKNAEEKIAAGENVLTQQNEIVRRLCTVK